ncbi:MAG: acyl-CoA dehydrogenase [Rhodothermales bacterium]|jgi:acyl-CoA dehydrogenase
MTDLPFYNFIDQFIPSLGLAVGLVLVIAVGLLFVGAGALPWVIFGAVALYGFGAPVWLWAVLGAVAVVALVKPIRRILSGGLMKLMTAMEFLPVISPTEQEAIDAGTVWVEGELFSGKPDFKRILAADYPDLTPEERAFVDGPVQKVCEMTDDWEVFQERDLPKKVWDYLAQERFFGLIIPKEYGGHGFSPSANSAVVGKLSANSAVLGITVMVPNSLGPAELLIHYGTDAQKKHYLPRLASHEEIPAFALTEPSAGSDAGAISSRGDVFKGEDGKLYLRLNWNKRYITLAPIATVLGLAFKMYDPENLLGKGTNLGITCALIQTDTPGVDITERHDPLGIPFYNGPTEGHDVVVPLEESIIGGVAGVGRGWRMLMESLSAGRGISLPATSTAGVKHVARVASAHAVVRKQFGMSIGKFEGIEEPLARIAGFAYLLEAARRYTCGGLDGGAKPAVVTAIMKYNATELFRMAINDGMDILGGNAISRGPRNALAHAYVNTPVSITVEGANILTRTLMVFGQGAIRCHPFVLQEVKALQSGNVADFDRAFWNHVGHVGRNMVRAVLLSLTRGRLGGGPGGGPTAKYYRRIAWASATFAFWADLALATLGGNLKRKEKLTGRFADIFSWMYLACTVLKRYEAEGRRKEDLPLVQWSLEYALAEMQNGFDGLFNNMPLPGLTWAVRGPVAAWSRFNRLGGGPSDDLGHKIARILQTPGEQRDRILEGSFVPADPLRPVARLENAFIACAKADDLARDLRHAVKSGAVKKGPTAQMVAAAVQAGLMSQADGELLAQAEVLREDTIQVDAFTRPEYFATALGGEASPQPTSEMDGSAGGDGAGPSRLAETS